MVTKKPVTKKVKSVSGKPIVTIGSHSVRTEHPNGKVDFVVDDVKLRADVMEALAEAEALRKSFPVIQENTATKVKKPKKTK